MLRRRLGLAAALLLLANPPAQAQFEDEEEEIHYDRTGFYGGVSAILGVDNFEDEYRKVKTPGDPAFRRKRDVLTPPITGRYEVNGPVETRPPFPVRDPATDPKAAFEPPGNSDPLQDLEVRERVGIKLRAGYRFHSRLALEAQFELLDNFVVEVDEIVPETLDSATLGLPGGDPSRESPRESVKQRNDAIKLRPLLLTAGPKLFLLTGRIQPFLHIGAGWMRAKIENRQLDTRTKENDFVLRFGGGIELYATENVLVNIGASYVLPTGDLQTLLDYFSVELLGIQYRF